MFGGIIILQLINVSHLFLHYSKMNIETFQYMQFGKLIYLKHKNSTNDSCKKILI